MDYPKLSIGQIVIICDGIKDPIGHQGAQGKITDLDEKNEIATILFDDYRSGKYEFGTFYIPDDYNIHFWFSTTNDYLLSLIATGAVDAQALAIETLKARGVDQDGVFIGFPKNN